jgi:hypothetical protein
MRLTHTNMLWDTNMQQRIKLSQTPEYEKTKGYHFFMGFARTKFVLHHGRVWLPGPKTCMVGAARWRALRIEKAMDHFLPVVW